MKIIRISQDSALVRLRAKIMALKMNNFSYVEESARSIILRMVNELPSAERLLAMIDFPRDLEHVKSQIGKILEIADNYGTNNKERRDRYRARTGLEPRYKHLEYKKQKTACIRSIIKMSAIVEQDGCELLSEELLRVANSDFGSEELLGVANRLSTHGYDGADFLKMATEFATTDNMARPMMGNMDVTKNLSQMKGNLQNLTQEDSYGANEYKSFNDLIKKTSDEINNYSNSLKDFSSAIGSAQDTGSQGKPGQVGQSGKDQQVNNSNAENMAAKLNASLVSIKSNLDAIDNFVKGMNKENNSQSINMNMKMLLKETEDLMGNFKSYLGDELADQGNLKALSGLDLEGDMDDFSKSWSDFKREATDVLTVANNTVNTKMQTKDYLAGQGVIIQTKK